MPDVDRMVRSRRVVLPSGMRPASIGIRKGLITAIGSYERSHAEDFGDLVIMPGLVDTHVHINEPGRTEWEGFATATQAAAAGGVTTLIDMPLNSVPAVTNVAALETKIAAAQGRCSVDVGFWGGVIPGNAREILPLWEAGCFGFKCFLAPSGVDEFPSVTENDLRRAMPEIIACGSVLLAHAEDPAHLPATSGDGRCYASYLASRPRRAEDCAIELLIRLSRETGCRVHIVHLSSSDSLAQLTAARAEGVAITVETCPHYLAWGAEEIADGATEFKCAPPIRESANRDALWRGLVAGTIDFVVSDHSPCPPAMKHRESGDFFSAWGGVASLELGLAAVWTEARERGARIEDISRWMSAGPAKLAGLGHLKGSIAPGHDADLVIWDPEASFRVDAAHLRQRHKLTPYAGRPLFGVIHRTLLRGREVSPDGPPAGTPFGKVMRRQDA
ncbi:MAG TPA: allantoinase AllB [Terriglobia bacterium]|nr:allantoinase AllB [Terriglobia bacterium]